MEQTAKILQFKPLFQERAECEPKAEVGHEKERVINFFGQEILFGQPFHADRVVLAVMPTMELLRKHRAFILEFCHRYLNKSFGVLRTTLREHYYSTPLGRDVKALIWYKDDEIPINFIIKKIFFARDEENRPVYMFGRGMLESCEGHGLDTNYVQCRMNKVWQESQDVYQAHLKSLFD